MGDVVSQAKFFIDFSNGDGSSAGNLQLTRCKTADVSDERETEVVKAIGVTGGAGYRRQEGGGELSLEVYRETLSPEVRWRRIRDDKTIFTFTMQDEDGIREAFYGCTVSNVARKDDDSGSHMDTVKIKFLRTRELS